MNRMRNIVQPFMKIRHSHSTERMKGRLRKRFEGMNSTPSLMLKTGLCSGQGHQGGRRRGFTWDSTRKDIIDAWTFVHHFLIGSLYGRVHYNAAMDISMRKNQ